jgi:hypothetical protein
VSDATWRILVWLGTSDTPTLMMLDGAQTRLVVATGVM